MNIFYGYKRFDEEGVSTKFPHCIHTEVELTFDNVLDLVKLQK